MKNESKIPNAYEVYLQELLAVKSYLPGQEVVQHLVQRFPNVEAAHARKIMQRAVENGFLKSSSPFTFGKGQYIYLSPLARLDKTTILGISNIYRPPLYRLLRLLEENGGILSYYEALKVTASPVEKTSSEVSSLTALLEILIDLKIAEIKNDENGVRYIVEKNESPFTEREMVSYKGHFPIQNLLKI